MTALRLTIGLALIVSLAAMAETLAQSYDFLSGLGDYEKKLKLMGVNDKQCSGKSIGYGLSKQNCSPVAPASAPLASMFYAPTVSLKCKDENNGVFEIISVLALKQGAFKRERFEFANGIPTRYVKSDYIKDVSTTWSVSLVINNSHLGQPYVDFKDEPDGGDSVDSFKSYILPSVFDFELFVCSRPDVRRAFDLLVQSNITRNHVNKADFENIKD